MKNVHSFTRSWTLVRTGKGNQEGLVVRSAVFSSLGISGFSIRKDASSFERSLSVVPRLSSMQWMLLMYPWLEVNSRLDHPSHLTVRGTLNHLDPFSYFGKPLPYQEPLLFLVIPQALLQRSLGVSREPFLGCKVVTQSWKHQNVPETSFDTPRYPNQN